MPIALDPTQTFDITLDIDAEKPDPRPAFVCRHLSCRDVMKLEDLTKKAVNAPGNADANTFLNDAIGLFVVGWKNIPTPFSPTALDDVLTPLEKFELIGKATPAMQVDYLLKKKFSLRKASGTGKSAPTASANGSATNPPAAQTA